MNYTSTHDHDSEVFKDVERRAEQAIQDTQQLKQIVHEQGWDWKTVSELVALNYLDIYSIIEGHN